MGGSAKENYMEAMEQINQQLRRAGYVTHPNPKEKITGTKNTYVSAWKTPKGERILVLVRTQQTTGTAGQKVPFFILAIWDIFRQKRDIDRAYIVLCGDDTAWPLRPIFQDAAATLGGIRLRILPESEFTDSVRKQSL